MNRRQTILLVVIVVVLLLVFFVPSVLYTVNEREQAVVLQFGKPVASRTEPGLYTKTPVVQEVRRLPATKQFWYTTGGEKLVDLPTSGGKKIEVSAWAIWQITDPEQFVTVLRSVGNAESAVAVRVRSEVRDVITNHKLSEVVRSTDRELTYSIRFQRPESEALPEEELPEEVQEMEDQQGPQQPGAAQKVEIGRQELLSMVQDRVQEQLQAAKSEEKGRGIRLVDVGVSNISFVPTVREAAFERLKAFMESIAAGYENAGLQRKQEIINETKAEVERILGEAEREASILKGQADAKVIEEYAKAIKATEDFYEFVRTLEVNKEALTGKSRLILTTDSQLFRLLKDAAPSRAAPLKETPKAAQN